MTFMVLKCDRRTCRRKARFATAGSAQTHADAQNASKGRADISTYQCPACNGWHVTHRRREYVTTPQ